MYKKFSYVSFQNPNLWQLRRESYTLKRVRIAMDQWVLQAHKILTSLGPHFIIHKVILCPQKYIPTLLHVKTESAFFTFWEIWLECQPLQYPILLNDKLEETAITILTMAETKLSSRWNIQHEYPGKNLAGTKHCKYIQSRQAERVGIMGKSDDW